MNIDRSALITELDAFARAGHGMLTGAPGVGKTYAVRELHSRWQSAGVPHLLISVERLGTATETEVAAYLGTDGDFGQFVESRICSVPNRPGVLVFDGYDAARGEVERSRVLALIRNAIGQSRGRWTVLVAVREYDASRSRALRSLFRSTATGDDPFSVLGDTRHFRMPVLNEAEVQDALQQIPGFEGLVAFASPELRSVLSIPFYLWLLERIASAPGPKASLSGIASEVGMLRLFWQRRVLGTESPMEAEHLLRAIAAEQVSSRSLSTRIDRVFDARSARMWDDLLSAEIIRKVGLGEQRVAFAHNILFDYAVSLLLLDEEPGTLIDFVMSDPARPFFLRPSFTYYFTRLWQEQRGAFWNVAWAAITHAGQHVQLMGRIVPPTVVAAEARSIDDFAPLFDRIDTGAAGGSEFLLRVLQALNAGRITCADHLARLCLEAARRPRDVYVWNATTTANAILERCSAGEDAPVQRIIGEAGRTVLRWALDNRGAGAAWVDSLGAQWALPLVVKTFQLEPEQSRQLLREVLQLIRVLGFPIAYFYRFSDSAGELSKVAADVVAELYRVVFSHSETSEEKTMMGTPIMPMTSTRRQDFGMCEYILAKQFKQFLAVATPEAVVAALEAVSAHVVREDVMPYLRESASLEDRTIAFPFRGRMVRIVEDASYIVGARDDAQSRSLLRAVIERLEVAIQVSDRQTVELVLDLFALHARVALCWRDLFRLVRRFPEQLSGDVFETLRSPAVLNSLLTYDVVEAVRATAPVWTPEQMAQFEEALLDLRTQATDDDQERKYADMRADRLLAALPEGSLTQEPSRKRLRELRARNEVPTNEPLSRITVSSKEFTADDWLREQGVDTEEPGNAILLESQRALEALEQGWQNRRVPAEHAHMVAEQLAHAWSLMEEQEDRASAKVRERHLTTMASCAELIARSEGDLRQDAWQLARRTLLAAARTRDETSEPREEREYSFPSWSPSPRTEAAQGLPWLTVREADEEVVDAIEALARDSEPSVRFLTAVELFRLRWTAEERFWTMAAGMAAREANGVVLSGLFQSFDKLGEKDAGRVAEMLERIERREVVPRERSDVGSAYAHLLARLALTYDEAWASKALVGLAKQPSSNPELLKTIVVDAATTLKPVYLEDPEIRPIASRAVGWLNGVLDECIRWLTSGTAGSGDPNGQAEYAGVYEVVDQVASRLYFNVWKGDVDDGAGGRITRDYYETTRPLLDRVVHFGNAERGSLHARTAHHIMEYLSLCLEFDVAGVLSTAAQVIRASEPAGYNLDSMAVSEVVAIVERILADHREVVASGSALEDLVSVLDAFARAGWPEAQRTLWRLDEVFR